MNIIPDVTNKYRLGIPGQFDTELFHSTDARIAAATEKASVDGRKVFVGLGGSDTRLDILEMSVKKHPTVRFAMAGLDLAVLIVGMQKQAFAMSALSEQLQ